ncbi:hypothetical protein ABG79_00288 [Caloramator mitchellensis]|uniref:Uncharacterized protein n=1 Tax=Caloramator mitchellensis TaxID=908809 RepID=A0A0R3JX71_CALMK|nr:hypothetical protein [Caloramator mitchellensis]KRQ88120.1 hypothetical protein ABG79_00288 [Caloramator mitchellensis]
MNDINKGVVIYDDKEVISEKIIEKEIEQFKLIQNFIKSQMKEGEDYGKIPGSPKPSLFKPGAEKLCNLYGFTINVDIIEKVENWKEGFFYYLCKCSLRSKRTGEIISEGLGSCNSKETKFARQNSYTIVNTILKMAKKRALIDATLSATRTSGIFTQDVEDMDEILATNETVEIKEDKIEYATTNQRNYILKLAKDKNLSEDDFKKLTHDLTGKIESKEWTKDDASRIIQELKGSQK